MNVCLHTARFLRLDIENPLIKEWFNPQLKMGLPVAVNTAKITPQTEAQLPRASRFCPLTISTKYHSIMMDLTWIKLNPS